MYERQGDLLPKFELNLLKADAAWNSNASRLFGKTPMNVRLRTGVKLISIRWANSRNKNQQHDKNVLAEVYEEDMHRNDMRRFYVTVSDAQHFTSAYHFQ